MVRKAGLGKAMEETSSNDRTVEALQDVLMAMIPPINQKFFHSRMLRA